MFHCQTACQLQHPLGCMDTLGVDVARGHEEHTFRCCQPPLVSYFHQPSPCESGRWHMAVPIVEVRGRLRSSPTSPPSSQADLGLGGFQRFTPLGLETPREGYTGRDVGLQRNSATCTLWCGIISPDGTAPQQASSAGGRSARDMHQDWRHRWPSPTWMAGELTCGPVPGALVAGREGTSKQR